MFNSWRHIAFCLVVLNSFFLTISCFPPDEAKYTQVTYSLDDPEVRRILELKDRHSRDSLLTYLNHEVAAYRYLATMSFASFRDSVAIDALILLLNDPVEKIKQAAVFSLGQIGNPKAEKALINAFIGVDSTGPYKQTNGMILEALGKCGTDSTLQLICSVKSYAPEDTALVYGQMCAYYRFGLRDLFCPDSRDRIFEIATQDNYPLPSRLMAAHCLQRFKNFDLSNHFEQLKKACNEEKNPEIRMCLVTALSRINNTAALSAMEELYSRGLDVRIQANLLRGLAQHNSNQARLFAVRAVQNPSLHVSIHAAQYLVDKGNADIAEELKSLTEPNNLPWQIRSLLYEAALKHIPPYLVLTRQAIEARLRNLINQAKNPYEKASYLKVLTADTKALRYLIGLDSRELHPYIKTTIAECIAKILNKTDFGIIYQGSKNSIYNALADYFTRQCEIADAGTLATITTVFEKPQYNLLRVFKADSMFAAAQSKLKLPRDIETFNELGKCIAGLHKVKFESKLPDYNHPVNWSTLDNTGDTIQAVISTNKGEIGIELYPLHAPASVINFIQLVKDNFYTDKVFHRVVPNFVVQAGCPRGDGYGALDYSIRTEISLLNYQESGIIGMASAGPDTEGTQFFITHSPTPHLDGRYTVMGKMTSGNEVLMSISQGDVIRNIKIDNYR